MTVDPLEAARRENAELRDRVENAERNTARTLLRATRLAQVIAVLGQDIELDAIVERAAVQLGELFAADVALLSLGPDDALGIAGHYGVRPRDLPAGTFALPEIDGPGHVAIGPAGEVPVPDFLERYGAQHVAWARVVVGDEPLGHLTLVRRAPNPFERNDAEELKAIAHRIALAIENGRLHRRMTDQLARLRRLHEITKELAGTMELDTIGRRVAEVLVSDVPVRACTLAIERPGGLDTLSCAGTAAHDETWQDIALQAGGASVGRVAIAGAPEPGTEAHEMLGHLLGIAALALEKALLYARSREQARRDSLTGLLGHQAFQERIEGLVADDERFCLALIDIDDFKQVNDVHGHLVGDETLRRVAEAMRASDDLFRIGGEEFCAVLLGADAAEGRVVAERLRLRVAAMTDGLPVTVSVGLAAHPEHGTSRDELLAAADIALYASKRAGKNRTTVAGATLSTEREASERVARLALLHAHDPSGVAHGAQVATLAVEVARHLGLEEARIADLRTAAQLHDIGKIAVPAAVLRKRLALDEGETRLLQVHPAVGASLLRAWGITGPARFVEEHHEHVDGGGYPHGLRGAEIALESRIIAAADEYVRAGGTAGLLAGADRRYDGEVVSALLAVLAAPLAGAA